MATARILPYLLSSWSRCQNRDWMLPDLIRIVINAVMQAEHSEHLQGERGYSPRAYDNSKLANILFTIELARRLEGTGVTVNALHPGFVATGFAKNNGRVIASIVRLFAPLVARSPAKGAETLIYLAC